MKRAGNAPRDKLAQPGSGRIEIEGEIKRRQAWINGYGGAIVSARKWESMKINTQNEQERPRMMNYLEGCRKDKNRRRNKMGASLNKRGLVQYS